MLISKVNLFITQGNSNEVNQINDFIKEKKLLEEKIELKDIQILKIPSNQIDINPDKEILKEEVEPKKESIINFKIVLTLEKVKEILVHKEQRRLFFEVSIWSKLKHMLCKKTLSEKESFYMKIYKKCEEIIIREMDMINYLKFMQEYTHFKCILFNDIHSLCLSFMQKPKVYENNRFTKINSDNHKKVFDIFNHFKSKNQKSKEDLIIFEFLSKTLKKIIQKFR